VRNDHRGGRLRCRASLTISRGCTLAPSIVPRNNSWNWIRANGAYRGRDSKILSCSRSRSCEERKSPGCPGARERRGRRVRGLRQLPSRDPPRTAGLQFREARRPGPRPALGAESLTIGGDQLAQGMKALEHGARAERSSAECPGRCPCAARWPAVPRRTAPAAPLFQQLPRAGPFRRWANPELPCTRA